MPYAVAALPLVALIILLVMNVRCFEDATGGPNQIALLLSAALAGLLACGFGFSWQNVVAGVIKSIRTAIPAILILLVIGALSATWMLSGIVPAMIHYGLMILSPSNFLVATVVVCAVVSLATGSSWSTVATIGVALLGVGDVLGISPAMTAGAIISGAYFGDKISPLSDTTNLAAAMSEVDIFVHIRHMLWTTVPSIVVTIVLFGLLSPSNADATLYVTGADGISVALQQEFNLSPWLFLVPLVVLVLIVLRVNALVSLVTGALLGGVFAVLFQPDLVRELGGSGANSFVDTCWTLMTVIGQGFEVKSQSPDVAELIGASGIAGMLNTVGLIVCAMSFGGVMESSGMLKVLVQPLLNSTKSEGGLIASTAATCCFFNATASDQYLSIVVPGQMFRQTYEQRGLKPEQLSRTLEDAGTVTSVLVPWNTCGATQASFLHVGVLTFAPYCFFNLISPLMTVLLGYLGQMRKNRGERGSE